MRKLVILGCVVMMFFFTALPQSASAQSGGGAVRALCNPDCPGGYKVGDSDNSSSSRDAFAESQCRNQCLNVQQACTMQCLTPGRVRDFNCSNQCGDSARSCMNSCSR